MATKLKSAAAEDEYHALFTPANDVCRELANQIAHLVSEAHIELGFPIQHRVKALPSILAKIEAFHRQIESVTELQDFIGIRIILLFARDVKEACNIIRKQFSVVREYDTRSRLKSNEFGYSSVQFVIKIEKEWATLPTFLGKEGLKAEIQVRTLAQHVWAEVSQKFHYKQEQDVPESILRPLARLSALLEVVDLEFERLLVQRELYKRVARVKSLEEELNSDLLQAIITEYLPTQNRTEYQSYDGLLEELRAEAITTKGELLSFIAKHISKALKLDKKYAKLKSNRSKPSDKCKAAVSWSQTGLIRVMLKLERNEPVS
jgi:putative GTP pyrophosphokinase